MKKAMSLVAFGLWLAYIVVGFPFERTVIALLVLICFAIIARDD